MFTPIGYFAEQGGGAFDPTLGGTLSPTHWWDYSDVNNLTFSAGTTVNGILDKGTGGVDVTTADGWTFYNGGPTFNGSSVTFNDTVIYKTDNWANSMVAQGSPSTWVMVANRRPGSTGTDAITGNRCGYELLHQGMLGTSKYRATTWNNNNGAASDTTPNFANSSNKSGVNYGSFYAGVDIFTKLMFTSYQYRSGGSHYIKTSLNGRPFSGQSITVSEGTSTSGYIAFGGSGNEVNFNRPSSLAFDGDIYHIVVYHGVELTSQQLSDLYATM